MLTLKLLIQHQCYDRGECSSCMYPPSLRATLHRVSANQSLINSQIASLYGHLKNKKGNPDSYKLHSSGGSKGRSNQGGKFRSQSHSTTCVSEHRNKDNKCNKGMGESCDRIVTDIPVDLENGIVVRHNVTLTYAGTAEASSESEQTKSVRDIETPPESYPHTVHTSQSEGAI